MNCQDPVGGEFRWFELSIRETDCDDRDSHCRDVLLEISILPVFRDESLLYLFCLGLCRPCCVNVGSSAVWHLSLSITLSALHVICQQNHSDIWRAPKSFTKKNNASNDSLVLKRYSFALETFGPQPHRHFSCDKPNYYDFRQITSFSHPNCFPTKNSVAGVTFCRGREASQEQDPFEFASAWVILLQQPHGRSGKSFPYSFTKAKHWSPFPGRSSAFRAFERLCVTQHFLFLEFQYGIFSLLVVFSLFKKRLKFKGRLFPILFKLAQGFCGSIWFPTVEPEPPGADLPW